MNIGNINPLRGPEENGAPAPVRVQPAQFFQSATGMSLPKDLFNALSGTMVSQAGVASDAAPAAAPEAPAVAPRKSLSEARESFRSSLAVLKDQSDDDKAALREIAKSVDLRTDLRSGEKEWLFASEVLVYCADNVMKMTSPEKRGQPWTGGQEARFRALAATFEGAKDTTEALSPKIEKPDTKAETFATSPLGLTLKGEALAKLPDSDPLVAELPPKYRTSPSQETPVNEPPADPGETDPLVRIWESRRQESQAVFNDYKTLMQKTSEWKARILASRISFFWRVYGMHAGFIAETWRR